MEGEVILPEIRQDLIIEKNGYGWNGEPNWLIHDRIKNRFFRISKNTFTLLSHWQTTSCEELVKKINKTPNLLTNKEELLQLAEFLYANTLTTTPAANGYSSLLQQSQAGNKSLWQTLIHTYIFFRIPLTSPQNFLDKTWPVVSWIFSRHAVYFLIVVAIIGLYLTSRQWTEFTTTFASFLTPEGFALYALSLVFIKTAHELGHAYMAKKYDVEVPTIGAAFILMMPILYTDTSAAWRLESRNKRLMIDFAGIFTELSIASLATIAWVFLPDGSVRAIAFSIATLSWIMSLSVNLNPFMKFDGYYILSDFLRFENLQTRGFGLAKWWLRTKIFGIQLECPEQIEQQPRRFIILYSFGVWIYRFFLFLAIALIVYHFFFKLLGLFLFGVEIIWFIILPIWREIKEWWKMKEEIKAEPRSKSLFGIPAILIIALFIPWSRNIEAPAILGQSKETRIFSPLNAQILQVMMKEGMVVKKGQLLLELNSEELDNEIQQLELEKKAIEVRLSRAHANEGDRSQMQVIVRQSEAVSNRLAGLVKKLKELEIRAPHEGIVVDTPYNIHPGRWISDALQLALIRSTGSIEFEALIDEYSRRRIGKNTQGTFYPDDRERSEIEVKLSSLANISGSGNELEYLRDSAGSIVPVQPSANNGFMAIDAWFSLRFVPTKTITSPDQIVRGLIVMDAEPESFATRIFRRVASVLVREAGI